MYKTGDINQNSERLKIELKKIKYPVENFESENITSGNPLYFLPIIHYVILDYSKHIAKLLLDKDYELFSKNDQEFVSKVFKALIELFNFKPNVTIKQFFSFGYAEAKVILCLEIIRIIKGEHNNLVKKVYSAKPPVSKIKKANDSFRSLKNNEVENFADYPTNILEKNKFSAVRRGIDNYENYENSEKNENFYKISKLNQQDEIEEDFPNVISPKFNETPVKRNYNFDTRILKKNVLETNFEIERFDKERVNEKSSDDHENYLLKDEDRNFIINYNSEKKPDIMIDTAIRKNKINSGKGNLSGKNLNLNKNLLLGNESPIENENINSKNKNFLNYVGDEVINDNNIKRENVVAVDSDSNKNKKEFSKINNIYTIPKSDQKNNHHSNRYKELDQRALNENKILSKKEDQADDDYIIDYKQHPQVRKKNVEENWDIKQEALIPQEKENFSILEKEKILDSKVDERENFGIPLNSIPSKNLIAGKEKVALGNTKPQFDNTSAGNPTSEKQDSLHQNKNSFIEFSSLIEIINTLANSVKEMTNKVEDFKTSMENRVEKLEAELTLIKNRISLIENKNSSNFSNSLNHLNNINNINSSIQNKNKNSSVNNIQESISNNLNNTNEENEHIFSFADDHNINFQNNLIGIDEKNMKKNHSVKNKLVSNNINHNPVHKPIIKDTSNNGSNSILNKHQNKVLNDIEDTDSIIQRIANRFKETQKLLNEFK